MGNRFRLASQQLQEALKSWEDGDGPTINGRKAISERLSQVIEKVINETADLQSQGDSAVAVPIEEDDFEAVQVFDRLADAYRDFKRRACAAVSLAEIEVDGDQPLWRAIYGIREWALTKYNYQPPSPISVLRTQGVGDEQIARIYGWFDVEGEPDLERVLGEEMAPGKYYNPKTWVHPAKKKRIETARIAIAGRRARSREYAGAEEFGKSAVPSLEELLRLGAPAPQIAMLHGMEIEDAEAMLRAHGHADPAASLQDDAAARLERDTAATVEKTGKTKK